MEKELKIVPPEGYMVDKENSTFECIKFKPIERWRDGSPCVKGWYVGNREVLSYNMWGSSECLWKPNNLNVFATKKQAKSALAMAQISQIMANDERFGGVVTDEEWEDKNSYKYIITRYGNHVWSIVAASPYYFLAFHTDEQRDLFLIENEDLVKDYLMIE